MLDPGLRELFPGTKELCYLDTASYGLGCTAAVEAIEGAMRQWAQGTADWRAWEETGELARRLFARVLGTDAGQVAQMPSMSVAAGQVAEAVPAARGSNVVVGAHEFRSNLFPWMAQERRGLEVRLVEAEGGRLDAERVAAAIDARTALVAVSLVQSSNGHRVPLGPVKAACAEHGARLFVDATQAAGAVSIDLDGIDYLGLAAYKWLLAPRGVAFLWTAPGRAGEMAPVFANWKTPADPYADYYGPPFEPAGDASRFDVSLAWFPWVGAEAGLALVAELGVEAIEAHDRELAARFRAGLGGIGLECPFPEEETAQIVAVRVPDPEGLRARLAERSVVAAVRHGWLRAGFHLYNDEADVDRALEALRASR